MKNLFTAVLTFVLFNTLIAQNETVFTYGSYKVSKNEFVDVYSKNNVSAKGNFDDKSIREYLDLYVKFKLKVQEAKDMKLNEKESIIKEFETYRRQLAKSYLVDKQVTEQLLKEAYVRAKNEIKASHILLRLAPDASPEDTLKAYQNAMQIRKRIVEGKEDFAKVATEKSEDPSAKKNGGDLGYFSTLQMVYPFECGAYNTKKGEISMPIRTQFGYHIIKVEDIRPANGSIKTAHLFVKVPQNIVEDKNSTYKKKIDGIYAKLKAGEKFETLVAQFSEDPTTSQKGGELPWFTSGRMIKPYEDAAFALKTNGDISEPIRTTYGWHIIKRIDKKDIGSFDDMKSELKAKIEKDDRSNIVRTSFINKLKKEYQFKAYQKNIDKLYATIDDKLLEGKWKMENTDKFKKPVFALLDKKYSQTELGKYIQNKQPRRKGRNTPTKGELLKSIFDAFVEKSVIDFEESRLEIKYPEFKKLMNEYRDGILLFELIDQKVWSKAVKDTIGLQAFHEKNKNKYMWKDRIEVNIYRCADEGIAKQARILLKKGKTPKEIKLSINGSEEDTLNYIARIEVEENKKYEKEQDDVIDELKWEKGTSKNYEDPKGGIYFIDVLGFRKPEEKTLKEARGYVISDYQDFLEKEWVKELRDKYPVKVDEAVLKTIIK